MKRILFCVIVAIAIAGCAAAPKPPSPAVATRPVGERGSVRGRLIVGGAALAHALIGLISRQSTYPDYRLRTDITTTTDSQGRFEFTNVSPGEYAIHRVSGGPYAGFAEGGSITWVDVVAGGDSEVDIGGSGRQVIGRVVLAKSQGAARKEMRAKLLREVEEPDWPIPADVQHASPTLQAEWENSFFASEAGRRYEQAQLRAHHDPEEFDAAVAADGTFRFGGIPPGKYDLDIETREQVAWVTDGVDPVIVDIPRVPAEQRPAAVNVPLIAAATPPHLPAPTTAPTAVTILVTDKLGKPLPEAEVIVRHDGGNIVGMTDAQGVCTIDHGVGPNDEVQASLEGYRASTAKPKPGKKEIHIALERLPVIHGKVVDAATCRPIARVDAMLLGDLAGWNSTQPLEPTLFADGAYRLTLDERVDVSKPWYVRIEAKGYLPKQSPALSKDAEQDFALVAAPDITGRVLGPDGKPVVGAAVRAATPGRNAVLQDYARARPSGHVAITDAQGRFDLWPEEGRFVIAAAGDAGCAIVTDGYLTRHRDIHLAAWASIHGEAAVAGKPAAGQIVNVFPAGWPFAHLGDFVQSSVFVDQSTVTDAQGRYHFDRVPAGLTSVTWSGQSDTKTMDKTGDYAETQTVSATAGRSVTVNFGDHGPPTRSVAGRVMMAKGATGGPVREGSVIVRTDPSARLAPGVSCVRSGSIDEKGDLHVANLPAGKYQLIINPNNIYNESTGYDYGIVEFTIPPITPATQNQPLQLPAIEVKPPPVKPATRPQPAKPRGLISE